MSDDRPRMLRRHDSPNTDSSQKVKRGGTASRAEITGVSPSFVYLNTILLGFCLGGLLVLTVLTYVLWTEYRLADLHLRDMKAAMIAYGIDPSPHMKRESP
jgi:hypothetical protein